MRPCMFRSSRLSVALLCKRWDASWPLTYWVRCTPFDRNVCLLCAHIAVRVLLFRGDHIGHKLSKIYRYSVSNLRHTIFNGPQSNGRLSKVDNHPYYVLTSRYHSYPREPQVHTGGKVHSFWHTYSFSTPLGNYFPYICLAYNTILNDACG